MITKIKEKKTTVKKEKKVKTKKAIVKPQIIRGRVVSVKIPTTVTILTVRRRVHPLYHKAFTRSKKYLVHDELGVSLGDIVDIIKVRPISKNKHFKVLKVIGKDIEAVVSKQLQEEAAEAIAEVIPEEKEIEEKGEK